MASFTDFVKTLNHRAFVDLDISGHTIDIQGWMESTFNEQFADMLNTVKTVKTAKTRDSPDSRDSPLTIIEVGTWKGLSATTMASICKENGLTDFCIIAVDTWLGAPEFWTWGLTDPTRGISLECKNGFPSVFYTFTKNVKALGHEAHIAPFPISSIQGAAVLKHYNAQADIIYVDAAHEYNAVMADLNAFYPLLKPGGIMFGDDYYPPSWPGVVQAVNEFATANNLTLSVNGVIWSFQKP